MLKQVLSIAGFSSEAVAIDRYLDGIEEFAKRHQRALAPILGRSDSVEEKAAAITDYLSAGALSSLFKRFSGEAAHPRERSAFSTASMGMNRMSTRTMVVVILGIALLAYVEAWMLIAVILGVIIASILTAVIHKAGTDALERDMGRLP